MKKYLAVVGLLVLSACQTFDPSVSNRLSLVGTTLPDLISCAGVPTKPQKISDHEWILEYMSDPTTGRPISLNLLSGMVSFTAGAGAGCHVNFRVKDGYVVSMHYEGASLGLHGVNSACRPLIRECLSYPDRTTLPSFYDQDKFLSVQK